MGATSGAVVFVLLTSVRGCVGCPCAGRAGVAGVECAGRASGIVGGTFGRFTAGAAGDATGAGSEIRAAGVDGAALVAGFDAALAAGFGADFGAITSDASAFASESDNAGSGVSSAFDGRSSGAGPLPAGAAGGAPGAVPAVVPVGIPLRPFPPSRDVFLPCLAMGGIMASGRGQWQ